MKLSLIILGCLFFAAKTAPSRPTLVTDFSADLTMMSKGQVLQSQKTALSSSKMMVAMVANYTVPFEKIITQVINCPKKISLMAEPFFDETVCYQEPSNQASPSQCFAMYSSEFLGASEYSQTTYNGTATVNGKAVTIWTYSHTSHFQEHVVIDGKTYLANVTQTAVYGYYVTAQGNLLKRELSETEDITNIPNPVHDHYNYDYLYMNYVSPAPASSFDPPNGVTCYPTENMGIGDAIKYSLNQLNPRRFRGMMVNDVDTIRKINEENLGWTAGPTHLFEGRPLSEVSSIMKTLPTIKLGLPMSLATQRMTDPVPTSFDARTKWGTMCPTIGKIRNQGGCGSCWAFGATESLEDRFCIASKGMNKPLLSAEYITDCDPHDEGCGGGFLDNAWRFLMNTGIVLETCDPYQHCAYPPFPNCTKPHEPRQKVKELVGACPTKCKDGSTMKMYKAKTAYAVAKVGDTVTMQKEIMMNGPIEVAFFVYSDFMNYQSGVYQRSKTAQGPLGGHAVKILGWGEEGGLPYWLVANSWSPNWGDKGYFKIIRGKNECGIETTPAAGMPAV